MTPQEKETWKRHVQALGDLSDEICRCAPGTELDSFISDHAAYVPPALEMYLKRYKSIVELRQIIKSMRQPF